MKETWFEGKRLKSPLLPLYERTFRVFSGEQGMIDSFSERRRVMRDIDLVRHLLGLKDPWFVSHVHLDVKGQRVDQR